MKTSSRVGVKAVILVVSLAVAFLLGELGVRLLAPQPASWLAIYEHHPTLPIYRHQANVDKSTDTGETRFRVLTDEHGMRIGAEPITVPATKTVLWLGDSFTFGQGLNYEETFVGRVAAASEPGVRHLNSGVNGYGPVQYRQTLEHAIATGLTFESVVVVLYVGNDFQDCLASKETSIEGGLIGGRGRVKTWVKMNSHLYRLTSAFYHKVATDVRNPYEDARSRLAVPANWTDGFLAQGYERKREEMSNIAAIGAREGKSVFFVIIPTEDAVATVRADAATKEWDPRAPVQKAAAALEGQQILNLLDTLAQHDPRELYFLFDGHLNRMGSHLVANRIVSEWPGLTKGE